MDSDVAIHLVDGHPGVRNRLEALGERPAITAITRVELENGVYRRPDEAPVRRARLDALLARVAVLDFTNEAAAAFGRIVAAGGYSRRNTLDRMIAATALCHRVTLVTMNGKDFRRIEGLRLEVW